MSSNDEGIQKLQAELHEAKLREEIRRLERRSKLAAWSEYTSFCVSRALGAGAIILGGLDSIVPTLLPSHFDKPGVVFGAGVALLTGKSIITHVAKAYRAWEEGDNS